MFLAKIIPTCLVPALKVSVDDQQILKEHFEEFINAITYSLPQLLDSISHSDLIAEPNEESLELVLDIRRDLMLLICEQSLSESGISAHFQIEGDLYRNILKEIGEKLLLNDRHNVALKIFNKYQALLGEGKWKREYGASFGFVRYCDMYYAHASSKANVQEIMFILSIAAQFLENFNVDHKFLGLKLSDIIIENCERTFLVDSNIHMVIFKNCLDNSQKLLDDHNCQALLWRNIIRTLTLDATILGNYKWNEVDDAMKILFLKIKMESKRDLRRELRRLMVDLMIKCSPAVKSESVGCVESVRQDVLKTAEWNVKWFRWIRELIELFVFECLSISNSTESTADVIRVMTKSPIGIIIGQLSIVFTYSSFIWPIY